MTTLQQAVHARLTLQRIIFGRVRTAMMRVTPPAFPPRPAAALARFMLIQT